MTLAARDEPVLTSRGVLLGGWSCLVATLTFAASAASHLRDPNIAGLFNDFYDYWAAAHVLDLGGNPYDKPQIVQALAAAHVSSTVGTGYSYPILLAELMRPLGMLPPNLGAALFTAGSLAGLWLAVAIVLSPLARTSPRQAAALATVPGLLGPVAGTLYFGQVNLYLLPLAALAWRGTWRQGSLALLAAVKLYPVVALPAFLAQGRRGLRPLLVALSATAAVVLLPNLLTGSWSYGHDVVEMFRPDPYWSNMSVNGALSRLALPSDVTRPPLPRLPVTPLMLLTCGLLGAATLAIALRARPRSWSTVFALLLCYGAIAAPKNSLWNLAPLVVPLFHAWQGRRGAWTVPALAVACVLLDGKTAVDLAGPLHAHGHEVLRAWLSSLPLCGGLLLLTVLGHQALAPRPAVLAKRPPEAAARAA
jgi:hypothetical protein